MTPTSQKERSALIIAYGAPDDHPQSDGPALRVYDALSKTLSVFMSAEATPWLFRSGPSGIEASTWPEWREQKSQCAVLQRMRRERGLTRVYGLRVSPDTTTLFAWHAVFKERFVLLDATTVLQRVINNRDEMHTDWVFDDDRFRGIMRTCLGHPEELE